VGVRGRRHYRKTLLLAVEVEMQATIGGLRRVARAKPHEARLTSLLGTSSAINA
jgi:hypothetical protein